MKARQLASRYGSSNSRRFLKRQAHRHRWREEKRQLHRQYRGVYFHDIQDDLQPFDEIIIDRLNIAGYAT